MGILIVEGTGTSSYRYPAAGSRTAEAMRMLETLKVQGASNAQSKDALHILTPKCGGPGGV